MNNKTKKDIAQEKHRAARAEAEATFREYLNAVEDMNLQQRGTAMLNLAEVDVNLANAVAAVLDAETKSGEAFEQWLNDGDGL